MHRARRWPWLIAGATCIVAVGSTFAMGFASAWIRGAIAGALTLISVIVAIASDRRDSAVMESMRQLEQNVRDVKARAATDEKARAEYAAYLRTVAIEFRRLARNRMFPGAHVEAVTRAIDNLETEAVMYERPIAEHMRVDGGPRLTP